jgi:hypothetical protein
LCSSLLLGLFTFIISINYFGYLVNLLQTLKFIGVSLSSNSQQEAIDIDDEPNSLSLSQNQNIDLSKIRIIPLKRKRPTIPFNKDHPFFNPISEPNLELIDIAISISLKRLKSMEKETLVFPSDVDAEIRDMESKFSETLILLGNHVKERIKGKGMDAISHIMASANHSQAPRLTFYNHEAELKRLELLAAI